MNKLEINLDSTALAKSGCVLNLLRTIVGHLDSPQDGGYRDKKMGASAIHGISMHGFVDTMFQTSDIIQARLKCLKIFEGIPRLDNPKKMYLSDKQHMFNSSMNLWNEYISEDSTFSVLQIPWEGGTRPATEIKFRIKIYEDDYVIIYLCGTIDSLGKFVGGCYAIRDFKTTSSWKTDEYMRSYELSRQLRLYTLACKLMAQSDPDSVLGKIGASKMGAFIDAVFIKPNPNDNEYKRTPVYQYEAAEIEGFHRMLIDMCKKISLTVQNHRAGIPIPKEGIINGTCETKWGKCSFWNVCKVQGAVSDVLLRKEFNRVVYNPLNFNGEEH